MKAVDFVVRNGSGGLQRGNVLADGQTSTIRASGGQEISLNLRPSDMQGYARDGNSLNIVLTDGSVIVIENYFDSSTPPNRLYVSADGEITEVIFIEEADGSLQARFGPTQEWSKWSPDDDLIHLGRAEMGDPLVAEPEETSMLGAGGGGLGMGALLAAAGLAAAAAIAGDDDNSSGGGDNGGGDQAGGPDNENNVTINTIEGDNVINIEERQDGVPVSGTTTAGATVAVTMGTTTLTTTADQSGNWTVTFPAATVAQGTYTTTVTATSTSTAGATATATVEVSVDTDAGYLTISPEPVETDDIVNAVEKSDGVLIDGTATPGASVVVTLGAASRTVTADSNGIWNATFTNSEIPDGTYTAQITARTTDSAGNTLTATDSVMIDTVAPPDPIIATYERSVDGLVGIKTATTTDNIEIFQVTENGSMSQVSTTAIPNAATNLTEYAFTSTVPDGSSLIVRSTDSAGNTTGTYMIFDNEQTGANVNVNIPNIANHQVDVLDLQYAEEAQVTLTESQIRGMSTTTDTLTIRGGSDDDVTISGAVRTSTVQIDGQNYNVYTLGGATIQIDDDIPVVV